MKSEIIKKIMDNKKKILIGLVSAVVVAGDGIDTAAYRPRKVGASDCGLFYRIRGGKTDSQPQLRWRKDTKRHARR